MKLSKQLKSDIIAEVGERIQTLPHIPPRNACLFLACFTSIAITKRGVRGIVQAGSASFKFKADELDDGGATHFSYEFDPKDPRSAIRLADAALPEIHCWAAIPATQEIIDLSTVHLVDLLKDSLPGEKWSAPLPPRYFWGQADNLPDGWRFAPTLEATLLAFQFIRAGYPEIYEEMRRRNITPPQLA